MSSFQRCLKKMLSAKAQFDTCIENYQGREMANRTKINMTNRLSSLDTCFNLCVERNLDLHDSANAEDLQNEYFEQKTFGVIDIMYHEFRADIQEFLATVEDKTNVIPVLPENNTKTNVISTQLPPIPIPKFNGNYASWTSFHDLFETLIISNDTLSSVQKLHYLKSNLEGDALNLLKHYTITAANYLPAWEYLKARYDNKRILINYQIKNLMNQQSAQESANGIRKIMDTTNECINALKNLGINTATWSPVLNYILTQKLPPETHRMWEEKLSERRDIPEFTELIEFLDNRFRTLEMLGTRPSGAQGPTFQGVKHEYTTKNTNTKFNYGAKEFKTFHSHLNEKTCYVCGQSHTIYQCNQFIEQSHEQKMKIIRDKNLCRNCLSPGHEVKNCRSKYNCSICHKKHHSLIHIKYEAACNTNVQQYSNEELSVQSCHSQSHQVYNKRKNQENSNTSTENDDKGKIILLATALVNVMGPNGNTVMLRALLDQGSQASFITEAAVQLLKLPKKSVNAKICGIGGQENCLTKDMVTFKLGDRTLTTTIEMDAYVLRTLTQMLPNRHVTGVNICHLNNLTLADPKFNKRSKIDLVLGADIYCKVLLNGVIKGPAGTPLAQKTILGWILSGELRNKIQQIALLVVSQLQN